MKSRTQSELPLIDLTDENLKPGSNNWLPTCQVMRSAFEDHGGFMALYDKVDSKTSNSIYSAIQQFFDLSIETKKRKATEKPIISYSGQHPQIPLFESLGIWNPLSIYDCQKHTNIMWPQGNDHFCGSVNSYAKQIVELDHIVKGMIFDSYGLERKKLETLLESTDYVIRGFKYRTPQEDESNLGVAPHADASLLTILNQKVEGLEVKLKNGEWCEVGASPSLFLVMAGDALTVKIHHSYREANMCADALANLGCMIGPTMMFYDACPAQVWSNDRIPACAHRVFINSKIERYSTGLLSYAGKIMEPQEELVDEDEHPLRYKPFDHYGFLRFFLTEEALKSDSRIKTYCGI